MKDEVKNAVTPGPWAVAGLRDDDTLCVVQEKTGGVICDIESTPGYAAADELNARLIAAAPDMLAALKRLDSYWTADTGCGPDDPRAARFTERTLGVWREFRAAIAKAEGLTPCEPATRRLLVTCPATMTAEDVAGLIGVQGCVCTVEEYEGRK